jgi:hypothetical protein
MKDVYQTKSLRCQISDARLYLPHHLREGGHAVVGLRGHVVVLVRLGRRLLIVLAPRPRAAPEPAKQQRQSV